MEPRPRIERVVLALAVALAITMPEGSSAQDDSERAATGWALASAGPGGARGPAKLPPIEVASRSRLRSLAEIAEIAASGSRVAAITEQSVRDCHHVVAWRAGHARVIRFARVRSCADENGHLAALALTGAKLKWYEIAYGNSSYWTLATADMTRPRAGIRHGGEQSGDHGEEPGRLPPEPGNRRGVAMSVRSGAVVLTRASDGRRRTIRPRGHVVDAELENEGLFYAFNGGGARPGNIVFVPFAKLFA